MTRTPRQRVEAWRRAADDHPWSGYGDPDTDELVFDDLRPPPQRTPERPGPDD